MKNTLLALLLLTATAAAQEVPKFALPESGLRLQRPTRAGVFFDVAGPRSVFLGSENGGLEGWLYPLKVFQDMDLSFRVEGYPVDISGREIQSGIEVRPECTILTYSHSAFTVRQILLAPHDQEALVSLLDIDSPLPMTVTVGFRPRLRLMWPAGLQTPNVSWDGARGRYLINEEGGKYSCLIGSPGSRDLSTQPYQEEPKDAPLRFEIPVSVERAQRNYIPIIAASPTAYDKVLASVPALADNLAQHYQHLQQNSVRLQLPDPQLQKAYDWSLVGMDKGMVKNPYFEAPGLVAGFRTSGESERPGFAWFFGRDALWTALASNAVGTDSYTRTALEFLRHHQRADGKIPHEISQSAPFVDWFNKWGFAWASADATPLYVVAQGEYFARSGDKEYLRRCWPSIQNAFHFTRSTDKDGDGLLENTGVGHAWVEGGALYPAHEELYLQGCFLEAARQYALMAAALGESEEGAAAQREKVRAASEATYWLENKHHYAFALSNPRHATAEAGPYKERRQVRLNELGKGGLVDEDTVLPAVPMIWGGLDAQRAQLEIDHLGSAEMATDWGSRIIANSSRLYDPLAYHYGSVWPLFTGWVALAGYRYGRPEVAYTALRSNCDLTVSHSLGYVTELLSGDYCTNFGRSSYHQIWSEAMVAWPLVRGLMGLQVRDGGRTVEFAPQVPVHWKECGAALGSLELHYSRGVGEHTISWKGKAPGVKLVLRFYLPLNAAVSGGERVGDRQRVTVVVADGGAAGSTKVKFTGGTEVGWSGQSPLVAGQRSQGLRLLRSQAEAGKFHLVADGLAGQSYRLDVAGVPLADGADGAARYSGGVIQFAAGSGYRHTDLRLDYRPDF